ncbi:7506_t:CDS:2 [Paraglomus occultum]|uniref:7506_t:CDS:1 n=1 Tax=Paraglomus occultum TaxID=144539 RepID=A0A9N9F2Y2_9GLOM|nr:7506_t:CDS:2 [Paraglomus occultum]
MQPQLGDAKVTPATTKAKSQSPSKMPNVSQVEQIVSASLQSSNIQMGKPRARRLSMTGDRASGPIPSTPRRNGTKKVAADINNRVDDPVGKFRVIIDESVVSALLDCAFSDYKHEVMGYLGGRFDADLNDNEAIICRINHFVASERNVVSMLTTTVREVEAALDEAVKTFAEMGYYLVGWYRSNLPNIHKSIPVDTDIKKQQSIQLQSPNSIGLIVSVSSRIRPESGLGAYASSNPAYGMYVFRTSSANGLHSYASNPHNNLSTPHKTSRSGKGKGTENDIIHKVSYTVQRQAYMSPRIMQQMTCTMMNTLRESKQVYSQQLVDCDNKNVQRIFVDSEYESFLINFLKKSVLQFDKTIEQDFRSLAITKHHIKTLISTRINDILTKWQKYRNGDAKENAIRRRELEALAGKHLYHIFGKDIKRESPAVENAYRVTRWLNLNTPTVVDDTTRATFTSATLESSLPVVSDYFSSLKSEMDGDEMMTPTTSIHQFSSIHTSNAQACNNVSDVEDNESTDTHEGSAVLSSMQNTEKSTKSNGRKRPSISSNETLQSPQKIVKTESNQSTAYSSHVHSNDSMTPPASHDSISLASPTLPTAPTYLSSRVINEPNETLIKSANAHGQPSYAYNNYITAYPSPQNGLSISQSLTQPVANALSPSPSQSMTNNATNKNSKRPSEGLNLPSIRGLLELSGRSSASSAPAQPSTPTPTSLSNAEMHESNSPFSQLSYQSLYPSFRNQYINFSPMQSSTPQSTLTLPTTPPSSLQSPLQHILSPTGSTSNGATSPTLSTRQYIPIAPSPMTNSLNANRSMTLSPSSSTPIYTSSTSPGLQYMHQQNQSTDGHGNDFYIR